MAGISANARRARTMRDIETGLRMFTLGLRRLARDVNTTSTGVPVRPDRQRPVTRALRLQGRYMGLIRTLPQRKKRRVMAVRANKGVEHAIRMARAMKG